MGRRSSHTSDELRELIIRETTALVEEQGYASLSAREIARRIEYSPGTLYNVFENIDDLVITIEGRLLDQLLAAVSRAERDAKGLQGVLHVLQTYLSFALANEKLWRLLGEHRLSSDIQLPGWYQDKLAAIQQTIAAALSRALPKTVSDQRLARASHGLWVIVHGIAGLATSSKLDVLKIDSAREMLDDLATTYVEGLLSKLG